MIYENKSRQELEKIIDCIKNDLFWWSLLYIFLLVMFLISGANGRFIPEFVIAEWIFIFVAGISLFFKEMAKRQLAAKRRWEY